MTFMLRCAAALAVLISVAFVPAHAQEAPGQAAPEQAAEDSGSYLPPSARSGQKKAATRAAEPGATAPETAPAHQAQSAPRAQQKTIGLISAIGGGFTVKTIGVTVFGNEEKQFPIPGWKVDDRVSATTTGLLKKNFKVKRIPAPAGAFAALDAPGRLFRDHEEDFRAIVRKLAEPHKADYYLVVTPGGSPFGSSNQSMAGLGVTRTDGGVFGIGGGDYVHALTLIRVYDSQFKLLRTQAGSIGQETFMATVKGPHQLLDEEGKRLPPEPQAAVSDPRAKQITMELLDKSLAMTLPKLFAQD